MPETGDGVNGVTKHGWLRTGRLVAPFFTMLALALLASSPAGAAVSARPDATYVTDGQVFAVARSADRIYLGGTFTQVGPRTGPGVGISSADGHVLPASAQVSGGTGTVAAVAADGSGGSYIGGDFTHVGGAPHRNLAHIRADGTLDPAWNPGASAAVHALTVLGSTVYIGGNFHGAGAINGSLARDYLAAVDATSGVATAWAPPANAPVAALASAGSVVYAGGSFTTVNSLDSRHHAAAFDAANGGTLAWNPDTDQEILALAASGSTVYLGGLFSSLNAGAAVREQAAAVDAVSGTATPWNPDPNQVVRTIAVAGSTVYLGGEFTQVNLLSIPVTRHHAAAVDATLGVATGWNPDVSGSVTAIAPTTSAVYLGGTFSGGGALNGTLTRNRLAAVDPTSGAATAWDPNANGSVQALATSGTSVFAGGAFTSLGGQPRRNAAALSAADGSLTPWDPEPNNTVRALAVSGSTVYLGGQFGGAGSIGGSAVRNGLAAVDAQSGAVGLWNPDVTGTVDALAVAGSTVYAGGAFSSVQSGSTTRNNAAAFDAGTGNPTAWNPNLNQTVNALAIVGSLVYLGGDFSGPNSVNGSAQRDHAAAVDASTGTATGWDPAPNDSVRAVLPSGPTVYLGGDFMTVNGATVRKGAAAVDATSGVATAWDPGLAGPFSSPNVSALTAASGSIYLGGVFATVQGAARANTAAVDPTSGAPNAWAPDAIGQVNALTPDGGGGVLAGGAFTGFDQAPQQGIASFSEPPANNAVPTIAGIRRVGSRLTCAPGSWSGSMPQSYTYAWLRDGAAIAGEASTGIGVAPGDARHELRCQVTATNMAGSITATSAGATIPPATSPGKADRTPPTISKLKLSPTAFRAATKGPSLAKAKAGTLVSYRLSERATVTFTVQRAVAGRLIGRSCVRATKLLRKKRACTRLVPLGGSLARSRPGGADHFRFTGRLGRKALTPGSYRLTARAADGAHNRSLPVSREFRVLRPARH